MKQCNQCNLNLEETAFRVKEVRNGVKKYASKCKVCEYMLTKNYDVPLPPNTKHCKLCDKILPTSNFTHNYGRCRSCVNKQQRKNPDYVKNPEEKTCNECNCTLPLEDFHKNGLTRQGKVTYSHLCKSCANKKYSDKRKGNEDYLTKSRVRKYNISVEDFHKMKIEQNNKCFICEETTTKLVIDHCHQSGNVRKLLCSNCNFALGMVKENINTLNNMINYINLFKN